MTLEELTNSLLRAYYDARKHKRNKNSQLQFEENFEENIVHLAFEIFHDRYTLQPSTCFMVTNPVKREVFAAEFRDRIIHHFIYTAISPMFERTFIEDCYSCRTGKGTLYGARRLHQHIKTVSKNFTEEAYILKLDLQGYFMSIDRHLLYQKVIETMTKFRRRKAPCGKKWEERIDYPLMQKLLKQVIYNNPTQDCVMRGKPSQWNDLPLNKTLFGTGKGCGLPIGNLTSQLFSNIYLSDFDNYCKRDLALKHYGRYVDDFYILHTDKSHLLQLVDTIRVKLKDELLLTLHPKKIYLQSIYKGVTFLGFRIKGANFMIGRRQKVGLKQAVHQYNNCRQQKAEHKLMKFNVQINSYLGGMVHTSSYRFRKRWIDKINVKSMHYIAVNSNYTKIKSRHHFAKPRITSIEDDFMC